MRSQSKTRKTTKTPPPAREPHGRVARMTRRITGPTKAQRADRARRDSDRVERLRRWQRKLFLLLKYNKRAQTLATLDDLLFLLVDEAKELLEAERATVFLVDEKRSELWSKVASSAPPIRIPITKGIAGATAITGEILNIRNVYKDPRFNPEVDRQTGYRTRSALAAPMFDAQGKVIGVFQVLNHKGGRPFDHNDEELLALLADQTSGQVENAQLYDALKKGAQETIIRLAAAVEYKDGDTEAHLWRMSQYAAIIATEMGFPPDWVENLRLAAPMHDIGKVGVPDAVLNKPGKLDPAEWAHIKKHPLYGAEILKGSENELIQMSATIALNHHERWDGGGYPNGIVGVAIPVEARIAALADVFDALMSARSYKASIPVDETLAIIRRDAGSHFDPDVVNAFFRALPRIQEILQDRPPVPIVNPKPAA